jgi:hypothetical protein
MAKKKTKKTENYEATSFYIKPTSTFVLSRATKTMLACMPFRNQEERNTFKRQMIQAELAEREAKSRPLSTKKDREDV